MGRPPTWDQVLRAGVIHSLSQRGTHGGWSVANHRGRARLNLTQAAAGGRRRQILLPLVWQADQMDAIRDAVLAIHEAHQGGAPIDQAVSQACAPTPDEAAPELTAVQRHVDWAALIERFRQHKLSSGAIKPSTWGNTYAGRMAAIHKAAMAVPPPVNARQLLDRLVAPVKEHPGTRGRQLLVQQTAALLRWSIDNDLLPMHWSPPLNLAGYVGRRRDARPVTTPLAVPHLLEVVASIPDPRWRLAFQLMAAYGLRPEELQHLEHRGGRLWCTFEKTTPKGKTRPRPLRLLPSDQWAVPWQLESVYEKQAMPPMRPGHGAEDLRTYMRRRAVWEELRQRYEAEGEKLVLYSCRHGYAHRAHVICELPPKVVAAAMGHSVETHLAAYSRWCGDDVVDDAFSKAAQRLSGMTS